MQYSVNLGAGMPEVCRLGLATRGGSRLRPTDAEFAIARGLNYLNWCGYRDALSQTIAALGPERSKVVVAVQFESRAAADAVREFDYISNQLRTGYNAAHRGAERDIFPVTSERKMPVVTFTGLRWGALLRSTADDPPGHQPPSPRDC